MPKREISFQKEKYYHVFNRGVDKRRIFLSEKDYIRFLESMKEFNTSGQVGSLYNLKKSKQEAAARLLYSSLAAPLVTIVSYVLLPNHYHFLLRQEKEKGVSKFMQKIAQGCTNYFNFKYKRTGSLFGCPFKSVAIKSDGQLWQASCYINGNAEIHGIDKAKKWPWSSCMDYLGLRQGKLCAKDLVLKDFKNIDEYKELLKTVIKTAKEKKEVLKEIVLE